MTKNRSNLQRKENSSKKTNHRIHSTSTGEWSNKEKRTNERRKKKSKLKKSKKEQSPYRPDQHWGCFSSSRHLKHGRSLLSGSWTGKNGKSWDYGIGDEKMGNYGIKSALKTLHCDNNFMFFFYRRSPLFSLSLLQVDHLLAELNLVFKDGSLQCNGWKLYPCSKWWILSSFGKLAFRKC